MLAEQAKPSMRGSGLCPGHTIGRCILSDAASLSAYDQRTVRPGWLTVAAVRGDRFLTTDLSSKALTSWSVRKRPSPAGAG
jgi:hypothetical protein